MFVQVLGARRPYPQPTRPNPRQQIHVPTTGWIPDEIIYDDSYELTIPVDAPAGIYQLITGLYNAQTGQRLTLADQSGDAITIPIPIEVKLAE